MAADYLIAGNHNIPIAVMNVLDFLRVLPSGFRRDQRGKIRHDPEKLNLFFDSTKVFSSGYSKTLEVDTEEEFSTMKRRLTTLPIFLNLTLSEEHVNRGVFVNTRVRSWNNFMVYINPAHPVIKAQILPLFEKIEKVHSEGGRFSLEISLDKLLRRWYQTYRNLSGSYYRSSRSTLCITNFSKRISACYSPVLWAALLPCMLVTGTLYVVGRSLLCDDEICELDAFVIFVKNRPRGGQATRTSSTRIPPTRTSVRRTTGGVVSRQPPRANLRRSQVLSNSHQSVNVLANTKPQPETSSSSSFLPSQNNVNAENGNSVAQDQKRKEDDDVSLISLDNTEVPTSSGNNDSQGNEDTSFNKTDTEQEQLVTAKADPVNDANTEPDKTADTMNFTATTNGGEDGATTENTTPNDCHQQ